MSPTLTTDFPKEWLDVVTGRAHSQGFGSTHLTLAEAKGMLAALEKAGALVPLLANRLAQPPQEDTAHHVEVSQAAPTMHDGTGVGSRSLPPVVTTQPQADAVERCGMCHVKPSPEGTYQCGKATWQKCPHEAPALAAERSDLSLAENIIHLIDLAMGDTDPHDENDPLLKACQAANHLADRLRTPAPVDAEKLENIIFDSWIRWKADREHASEPFQKYLTDRIIAADIFAVPKPSGGKLSLDTDTHVFFYEQDFYVLSNFSAFNMIWKGHRFDTSEAVYHWEKFETLPGLGETDTQAMIRLAPSAHEAFKIAEQNKPLRRWDWDAAKINIMREILRSKAERHEYVRRKLLATGDRILVENSWRDDFWGWGENRDGQNMLGKLWMEVRAELRAMPLPSPPTSPGAVK